MSGPSPRVILSIITCVCVCEFRWLVTNRFRGSFASCPQGAFYETAFHLPRRWRHNSVAWFCECITRLCATRGHENGTELPYNLFTAPRVSIRARPVLLRRKGTPREVLFLSFSPPLPLFGNFVATFPRLPRLFFMSFQGGTAKRMLSTRIVCRIINGEGRVKRRSTTPPLVDRRTCN